MIKYISLICILITYIVIHGYLNNTAQENADKFYNDRINNNKTNPKVFDIMHKHLPYFKHTEWINNITIVLSLIPLIYTNDKNMYFDFATLLIIVNIIRDITINLTILPKNKECNPKDIGLIYSTIAGACYDKIFSGHFAFVLLLSLLYNSYSIITNVPVLIIWNIINAILILMTRSHYTIDIVVSFLVCTMVFNEYMKEHYNLDDILHILNKN